MRRANGLLMHRIDETVEQAHRHRFNVLRHQRVEDGVEGLHVQCLQHFPAIIKAFGHLVTAFTRDRWRRQLRLQGVEHGPVLSADVQQVAEAAGGDQGSAGALAFQNGVGGDCRAMGDARIRRDAQSLQTGQHGRGRICRRAGQLVNMQTTGLAQYEVGEGAADIDAGEH